MKSYESAVMISASPAAIWKILIDGQNYASWDSGIERVEGRIAEGETIKVFSKVAPGQAFPVKIVQFVPEEKMVWEGGMPLGLFKGVRTFTLTEQQSGTHFRMREEFSGPMLPLIWKSMPDLGPSFEQFAQGLKRRVEQPVQSW